MKCYICKKEGAKRTNKILSDTDNDIDYKNPGCVYRPHFTCDDCFTEVMGDSPDSTGILRT